MTLPPKKYICDEPKIPYPKTKITINDDDENNKKKTS
jgi:hypothetical protein